MSNTNSLDYNEMRIFEIIKNYWQDKAAKFP
jgi:hypothetical protein